MKKRLGIVIVLALCVSLPAAAITLDEARKIALSHAELTEDQVVFTEAKEDREDGRSVYEFEFYERTNEYDYEIDIESGEIVTFDRDAEGFDALDGEITAEEALGIALAQAGLDASEVTIHKTEVGLEDGRHVFEVEFSKGHTKYECEVDAATGRITEWDVD